jgi:hypothetical protein
MINTMDKNEALRYGYFKDFLDPTFLFSGNRNTLWALFDALLSLPSRHFIEIDRDSRFRSFSGERLTIYLTTKAEGFKHQTYPDCFKWWLSGDRALLFAQYVKAVIESFQSCHNYLDTGADDVIVVVSKDEYPDEWIGSSHI